MYFLIFLATSIILAIPTFGVSLLVFFVVKNWFDNKAMSSLLGAAVVAMREEVSQERYHINRAAIQKVFSRFSGRPPEVHDFGDRGVTLYWGVVQHPMINNNKVFSVRFVYMPRHGMRNTVFIKAAPGIDQRVLSADDFNAFTFGPLVNKGVMEHINHARPKNDAELKELMVEIANSGSSNCKLPNLHYGKIGDFADKYSNGTEWFPDYRGMRFWIDIDESEYAVYVDNLYPSRKDAGSVAISVKLEGAAQKVAAGGI